jgi:spore coat polysaccharide biosynthesis protein SpsF (cytidylyltransferase family)
MANRIGIFLQVRLNSSRMPGKALLNLAGKLLIEHTIDCAILPQLSFMKR